ncbi:MAG: single-stranded DNA-binding protein [Bacteroidales bacterium]|jgi:hypothetical protein|nr:single-stranded DNA-binding protein [Bacteroidales bacterium]
MKNFIDHIQVTGQLKEKSEIKNFKNGHKLIRIQIIAPLIIKEKGRLISKNKRLIAVAWDKTAEKIEENILKDTEIILNGYWTANETTNTTDNVKKISEILIESISYRNIKHSIKRNSKQNIKN